MGYNGPSLIYCKRDIFLLGFYKWSDGQKWLLFLLLKASRSIFFLKIIFKFRNYKLFHLFLNVCDITQQ